MPVCPTCKKQFHACSNCGLMNDWEYKYNTEECWKQSDEYKQTVDLIQRFVSCLKPYQLKRFEQITQLSSDYEFIIENEIKKMKEAHEQKTTD